jgi:hypothetical protein
MPVLMLVCFPCSAAVTAEPQKAAVAPQLANLDVVSQPLPVHVADRLTSTRGRSQRNRHRAASQVVAARLNQVAVHLPVRLVLQRVVLRELTVLLPVPQTVLLHVLRKPAAVRLLVPPTAVLRLAVLMVPAVLHLVPQTVTAVLQPVVLAAKAVQLHVPAIVLRLADLMVPAVLHLVPLTAVLQPVVPRVLAVATNVAAMTPAKSLS